MKGEKQKLFDKGFGEWIFEAFEGLYQSIGAKEGETGVYKSAKSREIKRGKSIGQEAKHQGKMQDLFP